MDARNKFITDLMRVKVLEMEINMKTNHDSAKPTRPRKVMVRRSLRWIVLLIIAQLSSHVGFAQAERIPTKDDDAAAKAAVQHFADASEVKYPWGWIRWLMNGKIDPEASQTLGIVQINPGQRNPLHMHPNCEELLYVISGSAENIIGNSKVIIRPGDLVRIPKGMPHQAITIGNKPFRAVISYSSNDRQIVNLGPDKE
jgi:mannose-6-phosphate isomerase-like protein (cupin superfamily)